MIYKTLHNVRYEIWYIIHYVMYDMGLVAFVRERNVALKDFVTLE